MFAAQEVDGGAVVDVQGDGAEDVGAGAGPVLEWLIHEVVYGHDEAAFVPDSDYNVGQGYFFYPTPLVFYYYGIIEADWLGYGDHNSGDDVAEAFLGGDTEYESGDPGGCEQGAADLLDSVEGHEGGGYGNEDNQGDYDAFEYLDLGGDFAGREVVGDVGVESTEHEVAAGMHEYGGQNCGQEYHEQAEHVADEFEYFRLEVEQGQREPDYGTEQETAAWGAAAAQEDAHGVAFPAVCLALEQVENQGVDEPADYEQCGENENGREIENSLYCANKVHAVNSTRCEPGLQAGRYRWQIMGQIVCGRGVGRRPSSESVGGDKLPGRR